MTQTSSSTDVLFTPTRAGSLELPNRILMAPMTRSRADDQGVPSVHVATYYAQRASAGLIISEGTYPSPMGKGYVRTPGIHSEAQVQGWQRVTRAVHAAGGRMFVQIMHAGRISHPELLPGGALPVAPSAVAAKGTTYLDSGPAPLPVPRALELHEIPQLIEEYRVATRMALAAGFDGVELHAASGYLPEQFLSSGTNRRTDQYGGNAANRARFVLELIEAMTEIAGDRVGIKIGPELNLSDIFDERPAETYGYLVGALRSFELAYLHVAAPAVATDYHALLRPKWNGAYFAGSGFTRESGAALLSRGGADAIVYGSPFIANPDLPLRFLSGSALAEPERSTLYAGGERGYTDYLPLPLQPARAA